LKNNSQAELSVLSGFGNSGTRKEQPGGSTGLFSCKIPTAQENHDGRKKKEAKSFPAASRAPGQAEPPVLLSATEAPMSS